MSKKSLGLNRFKKSVNTFGNTSPSEIGGFNISDIEDMLVTAKPSYGGRYNTWAHNAQDPYEVETASATKVKVEINHSGLKNVLTLKL